LLGRFLLMAFNYMDEGKAVCDFKMSADFEIILPNGRRLEQRWYRLKSAKIIRTEKNFYYQLVSNAILTDCNYAELIVYAPYKSELEIIRELARNIDVANPFKFKWISDASDDELPFLIDGGHYKNVNIMRFEVPFLDKQFLTERVLLAKEVLVPVHVTENVIL
jgi:hypothetical protein